MPWTYKANFFSRLHALLSGLDMPADVESQSLPMCQIHIAVPAPGTAVMAQQTSAVAFPSIDPNPPPALVSAEVPPTAHLQGAVVLHFSKHLAGPAVLAILAADPLPRCPASPHAGWLDAVRPAWSALSSERVAY